MPRRKKLDVSSVMEAFLAEIDARVGRALADAVRDLHQRIDRLERNLSGRGGKESVGNSFRACRKPGCNSRVIAHGLCSRHYQQWRYHRRKAEAKGSATETPAPIVAERKAADRAKRKRETERGKVKSGVDKRPRPSRARKASPPTT